MQNSHGNLHQVIELWFQAEFLFEIMIGQYCQEPFSKLASLELAMKKYNEFCLLPIRFGKSVFIRMLVFARGRGQLSLSSTVFNTGTADEDYHGYEFSFPSFST